MERFRDRLRRLRKDAGIGAERFSICLGCAHGYVDAVEHNRFRMSEEHAMDAAKALGISFAALTEGTDFYEPMDKPGMTQPVETGGKQCKMNYRCHIGIGMCCAVCRLDTKNCCRCENDPRTCGLRIKGGKHDCYRNEAL